MSHSLSSETEHNSCQACPNNNLDINHFYLIFSFVCMFLCAGTWLCVHVTVRRQIGCCSSDTTHLLLETKSQWPGMLPSSEASWPASPKNQLTCIHHQSLHCQDYKCMPPHLAFICMASRDLDLGPHTSKSKCSTIEPFPQATSSH